MSTKIYNGYFSHINLSELLRKFIELRPRFVEEKRNGYFRHLVKEAVYEIDRLHLLGETHSHREIVRKMHRLNEEKVSKTIAVGIREPWLDFTASVSVFPFGERTLMMFWDDNEDIRAIWESQAYIHDYHYQNQTDHPKNVSYEDWKQREKDWDIVCPNVPRDTSYLFTFTDECLPNIYGCNFSDYMIDKKARANHILEEKFIDIKAQELKGKEGEFRPSHYMQASQLWREFKKTEQYEIDLQPIIESLIEINFAKTNS